MKSQRRILKRGDLITVSGHTFRIKSGRVEIECTLNPHGPHVRFGREGKGDDSDSDDNQARPHRRDE